MNISPRTFVVLQIMIPIGCLLLAFGSTAGCAVLLTRFNMPWMAKTLLVLTFLGVSILTAAWIMNVLRGMLSRTPIHR